MFGLVNLSGLRTEGCWHTLMMEALGLARSMTASWITSRTCAHAFHAQVACLTFLLGRVSLLGSQIVESQRQSHGAARV